MELYLVGGIVRDKILGVPSKDHDFCIVLPPGTLLPYIYMRQQLEARGVEIFVETPEFLTIRGRFAKDDPEYPGVAADFVLARSDSVTSDGRRPEYVIPGTLLDDLARRDFTVNAMALEPGFYPKNGNIPSGKVIDPHKGQIDLADRVLRFVGDPQQRIKEDALRVMRALRFVVTKGFEVESKSAEAICGKEVPLLLAKISEDRRAEELSRMFRFNTELSLDVLAGIPVALRNAMFAGRVRLDATLKL